MSLAPLMLLFVAKAGFNPVETYASLRKYQEETFKEAADKKTREAYDEARSKVKQKAILSIKDVAINEVEPSKCLVLGDIYSLAEQWSNALLSADRYLKSATTPQQKFDGNYRAVIFAGRGQNIDAILSHTSQIAFPDAKTAPLFGDMWINSLFNSIIEKKGVSVGVQAAESLSAKIIATPGLDEAQKKQKQIMFASAIAEVLAEANDSKGAIAKIDSILPKLDAKEGRSLKMLKTQLGLVGKPYPALKFSTGYGTFDEDSLVGKVVILDFFAHWCGPCIASFPEMEKMYSDLHGKGLQVVGITKYYGYFGTEGREKRDMKPEVEYAKMADFIKEHKLPWSVMYGDSSNFENYGCAAIPYVVVIDKKGIVQKIKVGYDPTHFAEFRQFVEGLLAK